MLTVPSLTLNNGVEMPRLGLGVWQIEDDAAERAVRTALDAGYRSIDTAMLYKNESGVGRALAASGLQRSEMFITTKLWNSDQGRGRALSAFEASCDRLGLDYVDLYLIHWPKPRAGLYLETWDVLEAILASGRARAIGVSNFEPEHIQDIIDRNLTIPSVNQIECHPYLQQRELRAFHAKYEIATTAWSPLGQGSVLEDETIAVIAHKRGCTPAQVVLSWHLQRGNIVIPKSVSAERIAENLASVDVHLADDDLSAIDALDRNGRIGPHPNEADF